MHVFEILPEISGLFPIVNLCSDPPKSDPVKDLVDPYNWKCIANRKRKIFMKGIYGAGKEIYKKFEGFDLFVCMICVLIEFKNWW